MSDPARRYAFTVFTPTYNRAHTLHRVYDSLRAQTYRDFEWVIVDDGSTDGTRDVIAAWQRGSEFPIRYVFQENSGKIAAFNRGVREAAGELFLNLDSDDSIVPNALERLKLHWDSIPGEEKPRFSGVTALCVDQHGKLVGDRFPRDPLDSDSLELVFKYRVTGEKFGFHRTDVLREHPFPQPPGVKFVAQSTVWFAIARRYKTRFVNEALRTYYRFETMNNALSKLTKSTANGRRMLHRSILNEYMTYAMRSPAMMAKSLINYSRYSFDCGIGIAAQWSQLASYPCKLALTCAAPLGFAMYVIDSRRMTQ